MRSLLLRAQALSLTFLQIRAFATLGAEEQEAQQSDHSLTLTPPICHNSSTNQAEPELFYLEVLNDAVKDDVPSRRFQSQAMLPGVQRGAAVPQLRLPTTCSRSNDVDHDFLVNKGIYDLPHQQQLCVTKFSPWP